MSEQRVAVLGLGYVGLPLTLALARHQPTLGFDVNPDRIAQLKAGHDSSGEVAAEELADTKAVFTSDEEALAGHDVFIVTVPTPIDADRRPDLHPLGAASGMIGEALQPGNIVIYESTVYPGCTEEYCVPILERASGLSFNKDFFVGYSPERINPGDSERRLADIVKVTAGSTPETAIAVDALYRRIVTAGTFPVSSIRVAEAAKVIENTQRDVNIALTNEFAQIFKCLEIDTEEVLAAAGSKWNFLPFRPGLVGGHCIGVDPYYLVHRANQAGYFPEIISASRRLNDQIGKQVAAEVMHLMTQRRLHVVDAEILVMGLAFKPNCSDIRNTLVADIIRELASCNARVRVWDPLVNEEEARTEFGVDLISAPANNYDAVILAVGHDQFRSLGADSIRAYCRPDGVLYDATYILPSERVDGRL
ncbi:MAG: nucleotide sugar dehydrogenase [Halieaceae bacterium]|jgi:UDP-N-acetyl-D-galactosamine dehydrogenase|nr:nucleotide sugar dehydrogenase [Halieaceae bacterium]